MPFKLRLKRTKRYHVSSKNLYVVCVRLLDGAVIECTLTAESTGRECLENIAPRIELNDLQYFGLQYMNKKLGLHWTDLDKPLKKQLEKNDHSPTLYFGVTFYVSDVRNIIDDMVRYCYYLQLKVDIIEGRLPCTAELAVLLASYSAQADFGDFLHERINEYKQVISFPKNLSRDEQSLSELLESTLNTYASLQGIHPAAAELQYLLEVQQLDGYGVECYPAKDESQNEIIIGASFAGIFVKQISGQSTLYFKWKDIKHLTHNKKTFGIQTALDQQTVNLHMEDPDVAKYVWRMCVLHHQFFRVDQKLLSDGNHISQSPGTWNCDTIVEKNVLPDIQRISQTNPANEADKTITVNPYDHNNEQHAIHNEIKEQSVDVTNHVTNHVSPHFYNNDASDTPGSTAGSIYNVAQGQVVIGSQESIGYLQQQRFNQLPEYRLAPAYETVMLQRRMHQPQSAQIAQNIAMGDISGHPSVYVQTQSYPQPDVTPSLAYQTQYVPQQPGYEYSMQAAAYPEANNGAVTTEGYVPSRPVERVSSLIIHPTYNRNDLRNQVLLHQLSTSETMITQALLNEYMNPPPPYPNRPSNSTPDLAIHTVGPMGNAQPDLLSQRNVDLSQLMRLEQKNENTDSLAIELRDMDITSGPIPGEQMKADLNITYHTNEFDDVSSQLSDTAENNIGNDLNASCPPALCLLANVDLESDSDESDHGMDTVRLSSTYASSLNSKSSSVTSNHPVGQTHCKTRSDSVNGSLEKESCHVKSEIITSQPVTFKMEAVEPSYVVSQLSSAVNNLDNSGPSSVFTIKNVDEISVSDEKCENKGFHSVEVRDDQATDERKKDFNTLAESPKEVDDKIDPNLAVKFRMKNKYDSDEDDVEEAAGKRRSMGPLKMAAMNGLTISRATMMFAQNDETRAPKDDRRKTLEIKLEEGQVYTEFEKIPKKVTTAECRVAHLTDNVDKNRFKDVLPYDSSRVRLKPRGNNASGYINASHIRVRVKGQDMWYVAAQAPFEDTCEDFWQMVWDQDIHIIAMLTQLKELGKEKSYPYWPQAPGSKNRLTFGDYQVTLQFHADSLCFSTYGIHLKNKVSREERLIWHLQYTDWPDHGCPDDVHGFLAFLEEVESVNRHMAIENPEIKKHPILVHCSAGVGRSGVAILVQVMKSCLEFNQSVDVPTVLATLRGQRMHMVQTVAQYGFVYKTLIEYLKNTRLI